MLKKITIAACAALIATLAMPVASEAGGKRGHHARTHDVGSKCGIEKMFRRTGDRMAKLFDHGHRKTR